MNTLKLYAIKAKTKGMDICLYTAPMIFRNEVEAEEIIL